MRAGVDTGGTFTDFAVLDGAGRLRVHKVPSTPDAPERAILEGLAALGLDAAGLALVHGSTVATNAVLEGKGARTAFVTSRGFADTLTLGRQARPRLYDLTPPPVPPPVPPEMCIETGGRVTADGTTLDPLTDDDLAALCARIAELAPQAVAVSLLFSFVDDVHERRIESALAGPVFVARSSAVLPEYREYERGIATWLNARVGPLMDGYLKRLAAALPGARLAVMQSSAGTVDAAQAGQRAVHLLLSGPAGGVSGAAMVGRLAGRRKLLTLDMGGTSTDVALVDGEPSLTSEGRVAGYPVAVPMVDIHTIGAGGGSIAWLDAGGALKVGPHSAGADPGPACYGRGGREPTVTDAHLLLGRLPASVPLGGTLALDAGAARAAVAPLAQTLGITTEDAARGILRVADEHMVQALRVISVERGEDPRDYTLFPFGGAGGLHVCSLADTLGVADILFPVNAGVLSALGMLAAPRARDLSRTLATPLAGADAGELGNAFNALARAGLDALAAEGAGPDECVSAYSVDLRYRGQSHTLEVDWTGDAAAAEHAFHALHQARYGHRLALPVELINVRVRVEAASPTFELEVRPRTGRGDGASMGSDPDGPPVYDSLSLPAGAELDGPAIVAAPDSTLWLAPGWRASVDAYGNLALSRNQAAASS